MALAKVAKKLCVESDQTDCLEVFLASRLILLNKSPGLRPIGVGEVIRRIIGKAVSSSYIERGHYQIYWKSTGVCRP